FIGLVLEHQGCRCNDRDRLFGSEEADFGKHVWPQPRVRILEGNSRLRAPGVRVEDVADEENPALEDFARIRGEGDIDFLTLRDRRDILFGYICSTRIVAE